MKTIDTKRIKTVASYFIIAYLLNFFWETWHAVYLYEMHATYSIKAYIGMIAYVSLVDALLLLGVFAVGAMIWKNFSWYNVMDQRKRAYVVLLALTIAIAIELKGVYLLDQWSYNEAMPVVFGIGISPLLQLAVTGLLSIWLIRKN